VDDCSKDHTADVAEKLGITVIRHEKNMGYGGNQKTCYDAALAKGADAIVMIHPDYQYDPRVIPFAVGFLNAGICDVIVGSRIRTRRETIQSGMPVWKYISNRVLTMFENFVLGQNLGDFHSGFRAYTREVLEKIPYKNNSDDFVFDTEFLAQAVHFGFRIGDVPVPCRYFSEASSINLVRSTKYGLQTVAVCLKFLLQRMHMGRFRIFRPAESR
jgi:glycosyltransferase involved in cell wall biosynthesis